MGMTCGLEVGGFCRVMVLLVCVQAEVSPSAPSKHRGVAGCVHQYCYCREKKYYPFDDPRDFAYRIEVKENAPELLRQALSRAPIDIVGTGDYQPAERKFGLSRKMREVCLAWAARCRCLSRVAPRAWSSKFSDRCVTSNLRESEFAMGAAK